MTALSAQGASANYHNRILQGKAVPAPSGRQGLTQKHAKNGKNWRKKTEGKENTKGGRNYLVCPLPKGRQEWVALKSKGDAKRPKPLEGEMKR